MQPLLNGRNPTMANLPRIARGGAFAVLLPLVCVLAACSSVTGSKVATPAVVASSASVAPVAKPPAERFQMALELLQSGQSQQADEELHAYLKDMPYSKPAHDLVVQIETPLDKLFPAENFRVNLAKDESLSSLARTYLGDPLSFYALARYNGIAVPSKVNEGQSIKIPKTPSALAAQQAKAAKAPAEVTPAALFDRLLRQGVIVRPLAAAPKPAAVDPWKDIKANIGQRHYDEAIRIVDTGNFVPNRAQAAAVASAYAACAKDAAKRDPQKSSSYAVKGGRLYLQADEPTKAMETLQIAIALTPDGAEAKTLLAEASRKVADRRYKEGLVAFQRQDLDGAIAAWNKVLAIDPGYKDAQLNRAQALKLKENLKKLQQ